MMDTLTQIPYSREAEEAVLGAILINPECLRELDLEPEHFYIHRNQWIYATCQDLAAHAQSVDFLTVSNRLSEKNQLAECGGLVYLTTLIQQTPTSMHAPAYAAIIRENARRRSLISLASEIAKAAYDRSEEIDPKIPQFMTQIVRSSGGEDHFEHISVSMAALYDEIDERAKNPTDMFGMETGIGDFDKITGGAVRGELATLTGIPGIGKSILACDFAKGLAKHGHPGAFAEMEMKNLQVTRRALSAEAQVSARALKTGKIREQDWAVITNGIESLSHLPIYLSDSTRWTTASLRAELSRLKALYGVEWCVVDYFYLLKDKYGKDDNERTATMSRNLKDIAKDLDIWMLVIHSLNKTGINEGAGMGTLKGSGQIPYDADIMMTMTPKAENSNQIVIAFEKFREDAEFRGFNLVRSKDYPTFGPPTNRER